MGVETWVLVVAVVGALAFGLWRAASDGRFRGTHAVRGAETAGPKSAGPESAGPESAAPESATPESAAPEEAAVASVLADTPWADRLGGRATLLQFSSSFCAPCRATRVVLADVAAGDPGVAHVEVDAEQHLDVVRRLGVLRTPTTLVLDADGVERARAAGAPRKAVVLQALEQLPSR